MFASTFNTIGRLDRSTAVYTPSIFLAAGQIVDGIDASPSGPLFAVLQSSFPDGLSLVSISTATMGILQTKPILGTLAVGDIDFAPDGNLYHSNFSYALIRLDPATGVQTILGFGQVGALAGLASAVPETSTSIMLACGLVALSLRMRVRTGQSRGSGPRPARTSGDA